MPPEALMRIEQNLQEPFEQKQIPILMKQLNAKNQVELQTELAPSGFCLPNADASEPVNLVSLLTPALGQ